MHDLGWDTAANLLAARRTCQELAESGTLHAQLVMYEGMCDSIGIPFRTRSQSNPRGKQSR